MEDKHLDEFIEDHHFEMDPLLMKEVLSRTSRKISKKSTTIKSLLAIVAVLVIMIVPTQAMFKGVIQWIPGYGAVVSNEEIRITAAAIEPVHYENEHGFLDVRYAYIYGQSLNINVVSSMDMNYKSKAEALDDYSKDSKHQVTIKVDGEILDKPMTTVASGLDRLTGWYQVSLSEDYIEGFEVKINGMDEFVYVKLVRAEDIDFTNNSVAVEDMIIFADLQREGDITSVQLSVIGPKDKKNYDFDSYSNKVLNEPVRLIDNQGQIYLCDDALANEHYANSNQYYFKVPESVKGLSIEIPYLVFSQEYHNIKTKSLNEKKKLSVNKTIPIGDMSLTIHSFEQLKMNEINDVEDLESYHDSDLIMMRIHSSAASEGVAKVLSVQYYLKAEKWFGDEFRPSMYLLPEWDLDDQNRNSYVTYEPDKYRLFNFDITVKKVIEGPFCINLKE